MPQNYDYMLDPPDDDIYDPKDVCEDCGENAYDSGSRPLHCNECYHKALDRRARLKVTDNDFVDDSPRDIYDP